jgi:surface polysaccharide O-acyltransferase-like enzyme
MNGTAIRRNSVIESTRLIAMFAIVLHHYSIHGGMTLVPGISLPTLTIAAGESLGKWGVDLFVLITGYFLSNNFSVSKTLKHGVGIYVQLWTTSVLCTLASTVFNGPPLGAKVIARAFLPFAQDEWWFATPYLLLLLLSPFINILIFNLSRKQHIEIITLMLFFWCALKTINPHSNYEDNDLSVFVMLYVIAGYIRRYVTAQNTGKWMRRCAFLLFLMAISSVLIQMLTVRFASLLGHQMLLVDDTSPLTIAASVAALMTALAMRPRFSITINRVASGSFGIYLFSDHPAVRKVIWHNFIQTQAQFHSRMLPVLMIGSALVVFILSWAAEILRQYFLQRPIMLFLELHILKKTRLNRVKMAFLKAIGAYFID